MIVAALMLLAVGAADLARQFVRPRHRGGAVALVCLGIIVLGVLSGAWLAGFFAAAVAGAWTWLLPSDGAARAGFWPVIVLAVLCLGFVSALGSRADAGVIDEIWSFPSPWGPLSVDQALLLAGAVCFLLESGNVVVRTALAGERVAATRAGDSAAADDAASGAAGDGPSGAAGETAADTVPETATLKGGRLIGPLERVLVFGLSLASVFALLAAVLAAKGIVRFPEISRDGDRGNRAEYFLIGSLVSWVVALGAALVIWWAFTTVPA